MEKGSGRFLDAARGNDTNDGSEKSPWKTLNHAMPLLNPGETLYLRGGIYHENVYCAVAGKADAPITIRSYPGERAIIDGGMAEFLEAPATAWTPLENGEYRSTKSYKNIRDVLGLFGDSNIGLQTYWHAMDMRATNELSIEDPNKKIMILPIYCGPGVWYDKDTGYIHVRLAHTNIKNPAVANYAGETDPRKLPLVIAPFNSVPLFVDQAMNVRFQDLVIRGGGYNTVVLQFGINLDFDNVIIFGGSYCMRARNTGPLKFTHSALYGQIPPWGWRDENGLNTYTPRFYDPWLTAKETENARNIARLPTHALLVTEGFEESSVFAYPFNHDWEISYSEFADSHDAVYCNGREMRFHHNWIGDIQDDALYLSGSTPYVSDKCYYYENLITSCTSAFAAHTRGGPTGDIYVFRNVLVLRKGIHWSRPSQANPQGVLKSHNTFLMHGSDVLGVESLYFYQNTIIAFSGGQRFAGMMLYRTSPRTKRRVLNNLYAYLEDWGTLVLDTSAHDIQSDGNLHWCSTVATPTNYLAVAQSRGWETNSIAADPKFNQFSLDVKTVNDYRLQKDSPAIGKGVALPPELEDPLRPKDAAKPDIGALPVGSGPLKVGMHGRIVAGMPQPPEDN